MRQSSFVPVMVCRSLFLPVALLFAMASVAIHGAELHGLVLLHEEKISPLACAVISAEGAESQTSDKAGAFVLQFPDKQPGQEVHIRVEKAGLVLLHSLYLDHVLPQHSSSTVVEFPMARPEERVEMAQRHFVHFLSEIKTNNYFAKLRALDAQGQVIAASRVRLTQELQADLRAAVADPYSRQLALDAEPDIRGVDRHMLRLILKGKLDSKAQILDAAAIQDIQKNSRMNSFELAREFHVRARVLRMKSRFAEAILAYQQAVEITPEDFEILFEFALVLDQQKRGDEAVANSKSALEQARKSGLRKQEAMHLLVLGLLHQRHLKNDEARDRLEESWNIYWELAGEDSQRCEPETGDLLMVLAALYHAEGRMDEACECYEEEVEIFRRLAGTNPDRYLPHLAKALLMLASIYELQEKPVDSIMASTQAANATGVLMQMYPHRYPKTRIAAPASVPDSKE